MPNIHEGKSAFEILRLWSPMNMTLVVSTNVQSVGYDSMTATMRVAFKSGAVYDYYNVSQELAESMLLPYPWRRLGHLVKQHTYQRVG